MKLITAVFTGSIFMFLGVLFGALGSHALKARLTPDAFQSYMIAIRYMLFHGVAILALASLPFLDEKLQKGELLFYYLCWSYRFFWKYNGTVHQSNTPA